MWGQKSQNAMREFAKTSDFKPATLPTKASYFVPYSVLPKNYVWANTQNQRLIVANGTGKKGVHFDHRGWLDIMLKACTSGVVATVRPVVTQENKNPKQQHGKDAHQSQQGQQQEPKKP